MSKLKLSSNASGSGNVTLQSPNTNSDFTVAVPSGTGALPLMKLETAVTASGTAVDFTSIPSWVKRITVMFSGVSTNGTSLFLVQLGDAGGVENTGYAGANYRGGEAGTAVTVWSAGATVNGRTAAANVYNASVQCCLVTGSTWLISGVSGSTTSATDGNWFAGAKTLSDTLTQVRITTVNGTDTFDAGSINILYEG
jgi:hypothetical protein